MSFLLRCWTFDVPFAVEMASKPLTKSRAVQKFAALLASFRMPGALTEGVGHRKRTASRPPPKQRCRRSVQRLDGNCRMANDYTKTSSPFRILPAGCGMVAADAIGDEPARKGSPVTACDFAFRCMCVLIEFLGLFECIPLSMFKICDKMRACRGQNGVLADVYKGLNREKKDLSATFGLESS